MEIENNKILNCSAHISLGVDNACNKTLKKYENAIGIDKLCDLPQGHEAFSRNNTVLQMGLQALSKLLSPSHAQLPYSMYVVYKQWRIQNEKEIAGFLGFSGNRFGRNLQLVDTFLPHRQDLLEFFDEYVDEVSNKLVLAVSKYIKCQWFKLSCEAYSYIGKIFISPLFKTLGIDKAKMIKDENRN